MHLFVVNTKLQFTNIPNRQSIFVLSIDKNSNLHLIIKTIFKYIDYGQKEIEEGIKRKG
jgi:hypothetical protein